MGLKTWKLDYEVKKFDNSSNTIGVATTSSDVYLLKKQAKYSFVQMTTICP